MATTTKSKPAGQAYGFLLWNTVMLAALLSLLVLRYRHIGLIGELKDPVGGVMPMIVPWAGAFGGVTVSLYGCAKHARDWDSSWNVWHLGRPLLGAASGSAAFFIVVVVLKTAGGLKQESSAVVVTPVSLGLFFTIAFVCGFRDKYFLELVGKVAEVIFSNGDTKNEDVAFTLSVDSIEFGDVTVGESASHVVRLDLTSGRNVSLDTGWASIGAVAEDGGGERYFSQTTPPVAALASTGRDIEVTFTPEAARESRAELLVVLGGVTKKVALHGQGV